MTARDRATALLGGLVAGFAGGLFGVGGGILLVPLLVGPLRLSQHAAHGTSLAVIGATALAGLVVYAVHANVAWAPAALVALASAVTARLGARLARRTSPRGLARAFAVLLAVVAARMLWRGGADGTHWALAGWSGAGVELGVGAAVGLLAGTMGVGGGLIAVPAFALLLGLPQQAAQGTSLAVILVTAPVGALEHHRHGHVAMRLVPWLALGALVGSPLASLLAHALSAPALARAFAVFLALNAVNTWARAGVRSARAAAAA